MEKPNFILSEDSKRLLYAKALLAEIGNEVCEALAGIYGEIVQDKYFDEFLEKFSYPLDDELDRHLKFSISESIMNKRDSLKQKEIIV